MDWITSDLLHGFGHGMLMWLVANVVRSQLNNLKMFVSPAYKQPNEE